MSDRFYRQAIDALDEAGSRVYINNMDVPEEIVDLEQKLEDVREEKTTPQETNTKKLPNFVMTKNESKRN